MENEIGKGDSWSFKLDCEWKWILNETMRISSNAFLNRFIRLVQFKDSVK